MTNKEKIINDLVLLENRLIQLRSEIGWNLESKNRDSKDIETYQSFLNAQSELVRRTKESVKRLNVIN